MSIIERVIAKREYLAFKSSSYNAYDVLHWIAENIRVIKSDYVISDNPFSLYMTDDIYELINSLTSTNYIYHEEFEVGIYIYGYRIPIIRDPDSEHEVRLYFVHFGEKNEERIASSTSTPLSISYLDHISLAADRHVLTIKKVIYNDPATIILWKDGSKTVVKCQEGDIYNPTTGFLMCYVKKLFGNSSRRLNDLLKEWEVKDEE